MRNNITLSVTRLGDLLHFGQLFKPMATIILPKSPTFLGKNNEATFKQNYPLKQFIPF